MEEKIKGLKKELDQILTDISNPENIKDIEKIQNLSRKKAELERIILDFEKLKKVKKEILETEKLIDSEKDDELLKIANDDLVKLKIEKENLEKFLENSLSEDAKIDAKNVVLEIRPGTGGDEAELFASELLRMYLRFAENQGWRTETLNIQKTSLGGIKNATIFISGMNVYKFLKYESGVHRVQRVPKTEKSGRLHTSAASVAVLPEADEKDIEINPQKIKIDTFRSSGPGGQGVNTTDSAVRITHKPSNIVVSCQDERSQIKNKAKAMKILRAKLLEIEEEKRTKVEKDKRKEQIGKADRSEKIRTYNFPQDRITDHRAKVTTNNIEDVMNGNLNKLLDKIMLK